MLDSHKYRILILDFGSQYSQLIARRVRETGVYCELHPFNISKETLQRFDPNGIILSGGPESVTAQKNLQAPSAIFTLGCPILGICYGMQTMAVQLGGEVKRAKHCEFGHARVTVHEKCHFLSNIYDSIDQGVYHLDVWMSHGDRVTILPPGFTVIAESPNSPYAAIADFNRHFYGVQFHPEVSHTPQGQRLLAQFVLNICACEAHWTPKHIIQESIQTIQQSIGKERVLVGLSGGVDSTVTAALLHQAIGDQLTCVFVDTGLLRLNEADEVLRVFSKQLGFHVLYAKEEKRFLSSLKGKIDPEEKRKTIGETFIRVFEEKAQDIKGVNWLGQGTIYPDVIESAQTSSNQTHLIKSHHNVGGLPEQFSFQLIEPLRELFKDEVRQIGLALGLPAELIHRHPFPGPGLALRQLGEVKKEYLDILRITDAIFIEELRSAGLYTKVSQAFAVFLPIKSVGVKGDRRCYEHVIALRAVNSTDFMTAEWSPLPYSFLSHVSRRIINEVPQVSRVVYDISQKPPATIEWE